jgi:hypothetical protein
MNYLLSKYVDYQDGLLRFGGDKTAPIAVAWNYDMDREMSVGEMLLTLALILTINNPNPTPNPNPPGEMLDHLLIQHPA